MQSQYTWGELCQVFVEVCMPNKRFLPVALDIVMDTYGTGRIKEMTQNRRDTTTRKIVIGRADQYRDWAAFLSDGENKTELIQFIVGYYKAGNFQRKLKIPVTITCGEDTWLLDTVDVHQFPSCNHHEAVTRIIQYAVQSNNFSPVVVAASDKTFLFSLFMPLIDYH